MSVRKYLRRFKDSSVVYPAVVNGLRTGLDRGVATILTNRADQSWLNSTVPMPTINQRLLPEWFTWIVNFGRSPLQKSPAAWHILGIWLTAFFIQQFHASPLLFLPSTSASVISLPPVYAVFRREVVPNQLIRHSGLSQISHSERISWLCAPYCPSFGIEHMLTSYRTSVTICN